MNCAYVVRRHLAWVRFAAVTLALVAVTACGTSTAGQTPGPTAPSETVLDEHGPDFSASPSEARKETAPSVTGPYSNRSIRVTYGATARGTKLAGWSYRFNPSFGDIAASLTKDIETSPPGQAMMRADLDATQLVWEYVGDDEGRTGPDASGSVLIIVEWESTLEEVNKGAYHEKFGDIDEGYTAVAPQGCSGQYLVIACKVVGPPSSTQFLSPSSSRSPKDERIVDDWLNHLEKQPTIHVVFDFSVSYHRVCFADYHPDGRVTTTSKEANVCQATALG